MNEEKINDSVEQEKTPETEEDEQEEEEEEESEDVQSFVTALDNEDDCHNDPELGHDDDGKKTIESIFHRILFQVGSHHRILEQ